jgi:hypothetical protein
MMKIRAGFATIVMGVALVLLIGDRAGAQSTIYSAGQTNWLNISQGQCVQRAQSALTTAVSRFNLGMPPNVFDAWLVGVRSNGVNVSIACMGDDETDRIANPQAPRTLMFIDVDSTSVGTDGPIRDFLRDCMFGRSCTNATNGPTVNPPTGNPPTGGVTATTVTWSTTATTHRTETGMSFTYRCPAKEGNYRTVWGTDIYTDDSSICSAAVHAGMLTDAGGVVAIQMMGRQQRFVGSPRNGVTTSNYGSWPGSYRFVYVEYR